MVDTETLAQPDAIADEASGSSKAFRGRIARCKTKKREMIRDWQLNIDMRRGKASDTDTDDNRIPIPVDWAQTKAKIAQLFSQVPTVVVTGKGQYKPAAPPVQARLNDQLKTSKVGAAMFEALPDMINAAGVCGVRVNYEARTVTKSVPVQDPSTLSFADRIMIKAGIKKQEMMDREYVVDRRFSADRVSPADLLWPVEFVRSDFDMSPWVGNTGRMSWAEAQRNLKLTDEQKDKVLGDKRGVQDRLTSDGRDDVTREEDVVSFDEIFYWRYLYHPEETHFCAIHRLVFVEGITDPVIDEPWKGQRLDEELGKYVGALQFPIRFCTLNYITDETIPPSDSSVGRPQVKELIRTRDQMRQQRDHSKPINWFDVNRVDADIQTSLMMGDWQGFIPTQGPGDKALGQVARSSYPRDDYEIDHIIRGDLMEAWSIGPNQMGTLATGERSASEAKIAQGNYSTRIGQERARVVEFFVGIATVMVGLMALYDDFELPDPQGQQRLEMWDRTRIQHELAFSIRGDSTILLDAEQRIDRLMRFLNIAGKSGFVKPQPIIEELAALTGLDPADVIQTPTPPGPEPPNVSFRFSGAQDLTSPLALAILMKAGQAPTQEELAAAIALLEAAGTTAVLKLGSQGDEAEIPMHMKGTPPPPTPPTGPGGPGGPPGPGQPAPAMDDRAPHWAATDRVNSRRDASQE